VLLNVIASSPSLEGIAPPRRGPIGRIAAVTADRRAAINIETTPVLGFILPNRGNGLGIPVSFGFVATGTPATALLAKAKIAFTLHPYEHDPRAQAFGEEAAEALGVDPAQIFKTLIASVEGKLACGVVPVAARLDLKAFAAALGGKRAELADPAAAARATGYVVGGISPLGQRSRLRVVVDSSAEQFDTVYVSAGRRGLQVQLAPADLARAAGATFAPIAAR
jgi:Cys-tRNA(Pro)/Cys-tRNA(Cys) deacylase